MIRAWHRRHQEVPSGAFAMRAALRAAHSELSDDEAVGVVRASREVSPDDIRCALKHYAGMRDRFDTDRAYRLLEAAATGESVQPIAREREGLFRREEKLGRSPLEAAFAVLAEHWPGLLELAVAAEASGRSEISATEKARHRSRAVEMLLRAEKTDQLRSSPLAASIVEQYLSILDGTDQGDVSRSYFALPRKKIVRTTRFDLTSRGTGAA